MPTLADPFTLPSGALLPNRLIKAAMSERLADAQGAPSEALVKLHRRWAEGGAGMLITGNVMIDAQMRGETGNVVVEDDKALGALRAWAEASTSLGVPVWMQINHPGRQTPRFLTPQPVSASAVPMKGMGPTFARPRALEDHEIRAIIDRFAHTALVARDAGFSGVQLHGAHGYLVSQFLSPLTNLRDDAWGGDADRRRAFPLATFRAMRQATGPDFPLGIKLNSADFQRGGFSEEESMDLVQALEAEGVDMIEVSGGTYEAAAMAADPSQRESTRQREAFFMDYAEKVRARSQVPLMVTGGFRSREGMNSALASGATDLIGLARPLASEPDLPGRLIQAQSEAAREIKLATGLKKLDNLVQMTWYQHQLDRMGAGQAPDLSLGRLRSLLTYLKPRPGMPPVEAAESYSASRLAST